MPDMRRWKNKRKYRKEKSGRPPVINPVSAPRLVPGDIGQRIRKARMGRDWTGLDMYQATEIKRSEISDIERGQRLPTIQQLVTIGAALDLTIGFLLFGKHASEKVEQ